MSKDNGGPVFPIIAEESKAIYSDGLTLRDYFASKAMQALISKTEPVLWNNEAGEDPILESIAVGAFDYADAMLKARES